MSSDKKHGLGKGIGSLLGSFDYDSQVENIINKTTASEKPESASSVSSSKVVVERPIKQIRFQQFMFLFQIFLQIQTSQESLLMRSL